MQTKDIEKSRDLARGGLRDEVDPEGVGEVARAESASAGHLGAVGDEKCCASVGFQQTQPEKMGPNPGEIEPFETMVGSETLALNCCSLNSRELSATVRGIL